MAVGVGGGEVHPLQAGFPGPADVDLHVIDEHSLVRRNPESLDDAAEERRIGLRDPSRGRRGDPVDREGLEE